PVDVVLFTHAVSVRADLGPALGSHRPASGPARRPARVGRVLYSVRLSGLALVLFFVARIGAGVSGATIATAQAVIADCTAPEKRKHGMALIGVAFGIGFTFGPLIGYGCVSFGSLEMVGYAAA